MLNPLSTRQIVDLFASDASEPPMVDSQVMTTEIVDQDEPYRVWEVWIQRSAYNVVEKRYLSCAPAIHIVCEDDPYYRLTFESRAPLEALIQQLQRLADEAWPPQEPECA